MGRQPTRPLGYPTLKDLLKLMNKLCNEVAELKALLKLQESELRTAKDSLNTVLNYNDKLKLELKVTEQQVKEQEALRKYGHARTVYKRKLP